MAKRDPRVKVLDMVETEFGLIEVVRVRATGAILYRQGSCHQSEADGFGVSLSPYIHAIFSLARQSGAKTALLVGCGGGTLGRMLESCGVTVTIVDINSWSFRMARRHFGLPDDIECHIEDAADFMRRRGRKYDVIVLDAYHDAILPPHLATQEFFQSVANRLKKNGCMIANAYVLHDSDAVMARLCAAMKPVWPDLALFDEPGGHERNAILTGGNSAALGLPVMTMEPAVFAVEVEADIVRYQRMPLPDFVARP
jgi:spermidine synthase